MGTREGLEMGTCAWVEFDAKPRIRRLSRCVHPRRGCGEPASGLRADKRKNGPRISTGRLNLVAGAGFAVLCPAPRLRRRRGPLKRFNLQSRLPPDKTKARTKAGFCLVWLRGQDLNLRPSGYEPDELPGCSTPRQLFGECRPGSPDFPACPSSKPCFCGRTGCCSTLRQSWSIVRENVRFIDLAATYSPAS